MTHATITELHVYPVKSCRGIAIDDTAIDSLGLEHDRRWMVVSESGRFLSQRVLPRLALVAPELIELGVSFTAPGMPELRVAREADGPPMEVVIMSDRCLTRDAGPEAARWLSRFLERPARLVQRDPNDRRTTNPRWGGLELPIAFPDGFPVMVLGQASLDELNARLATPVPMNRFRPNVVFGGLLPYAEDRIHELHRGDNRLRLVWPCPRCTIVTTDQDTGEVSSSEPLSTLRSYRSSREPAGAMFGRYAIVAAHGRDRLRVGQDLAVDWK